MTLGIEISLDVFYRDETFTVLREFLIKSDQYIYQNELAFSFIVYTTSRDYLDFSPKPLCSLHHGCHLLGVYLAKLRSDPKRILPPSTVDPFHIWVEAYGKHNVHWATVKEKQLVM